MPIALGALILAAGGTLLVPASKRVGPTNLAEAAETGSALALSGRLSANGKRLLVDTARSSRLEVAAGELAQVNSAVEQVRAIGERLTSNYRRLDAQIRALAEAQGLALPNGMGPADQGRLLRLERASAADFDREYARLVVADQTRAVQELRRAAIRSDDAAERALAQGLLPVLEEHLTLAHDLMPAGLDTGPALPRRVSAFRARN